MRVVNIGEFIYRNPKSIGLILIFMFIPLYIVGGSFFNYPSEFEQLEKDVFIIDRIAYKVGRDAKAGIYGYSVLESRRFKYKGLPSLKELEDIVKLEHDDRIIEVYWFYSGFTDFVFDYRSMLGFEYKGRSFESIRDKYYLGKRVIDEAFFYVVSFCGVFMYFLMHSLIVFILKCNCYDK